MIEYTLAWLESAGVEEVFVFCCAHAKQVINYLESSQWFSQPNLSVTTIESHNSVSAGDALRLIYERNVVSFFWPGLFLHIIIFLAMFWCILFLVLSNKRNLHLKVFTYPKANIFRKKFLINILDSFNFPNTKLVSTCSQCNKSSSLIYVVCSDSWRFYPHQW